MNRADGARRYELRRAAEQVVAEAHAASGTMPAAAVASAKEIFATAPPLDPAFNAAKTATAPLDVRSQAAPDEAPARRPVSGSRLGF